ncbi:5-oxoprolinase [Olea europaea subsp. europaea]|uniref:5-oxoprolinase n=1 Tax=Olea europaea subsp. europaea TaxID=158383 RepID=A0A8S0R310_OLEEU|nr:5-oxoprolinase [Olea europaea subsp. europaea]
MSFSTKSTCINNHLTNSISSSCSYHNHSRKLVFSYVSSIPNSKLGAEIRVRCSASSPKRGFGPSSKKSSAPVKKEEKKNTKRQSISQQSPTQSNQAPSLSSRIDGKANIISSDDLQFEQRLQAIRKSALEQKKSEEKKQYGVIDYDAPVKTESSTIGLGTKIGVGVAVIVFGLVFALGDFLPSGSVSPTEEAATISNKISEEERENLQKRLRQFEETLNMSPEDPTALEGAAVTLAELGEYKRAATLLEKLTEKKPDDRDAFRLLGEVKYALKDYEGSAIAYRSSAMASKTIDFEVLRGLTNSLLAAKKPDEAVQLLLASRDRLNQEKSYVNADITMNSATNTRTEIDLVQVDLLLGKAYSDWGKISDAVSVYDQLISSHPNDFRGYLAKGIILKENGNIGEAERMFIQARFFAPENAKILVDKYSR